MEAKPNHILLCMQCLMDHLERAVGRSGFHGAEEIAVKSQRALPPFI